MIAVRRVLPLILVAAVAGGCSLSDSGAARAAEATGTPRAAAATAPPASPSGTPRPVATPRVTASPIATATPKPVAATPAPVVAAAEPEPFRMNLFRTGDFVPQYTFEWCVGASLQMMRNLTDAEVTRSRSTQQTYWELARDLSSSPFGGANPRGWTAALEELGLGDYQLVSVPEFDEALRVAAKAIRDTDRPVGLVMWRGRHAWVMSGFASDADPRTADEFDVTGVRVLDPLYPHGNSTWGPSPKPNTLLSTDKLARQFVIRDSRRVNLGVPPGYLLIIPV